MAENKSYLRQRKDDMFAWSYPIGRMKKRLLTPKTTVQEALQSSAQIHRIFLDYRTACVGCSLSRFCSLKEMTDFYGFDLPSFLDVLQRSLLLVKEFEQGE